MTTERLRRASAAATARPMPREPPVTIATLPWRRAIRSVRDRRIQYRSDADCRHSRRGRTGRRRRSHAGRCRRRPPHRARRQGRDGRRRQGARHPAVRAGRRISHARHGHRGAGSAGAAVVVLADEHGGRELAGDAALTLLRRTLEALTARGGGRGRSQRSWRRSNRRGSSASRRRDSSDPRRSRRSRSPRALTAMELRRIGRRRRRCRSSASRPAWVIAWADATLAGSPLTPLLTPPADAAHRGAPAGPLAARSVRARVCGGRGRSARSTARRTGGSHASSRRDGAYERRPFAALPVTLGPAGVVAVHVPQLSARERVALGDELHVGRTLQAGQRDGPSKPGPTAGCFSRVCVRPAVALCSDSPPANAARRWRRITRPRCRRDFSV